MAKKIPLVAIIGRTNVGKSTLFNALIGRRLSVTDDRSGVTRDRSYGFVETETRRHFRVVDTGGIVGDAESFFQESIRSQAEIAIREADLILAVFDGIEGVHPLDYEVMTLLRESDKPVLAAINKCEKEITKLGSSEFYALGIEDLVCVSSAHREGIRELIEGIDEQLGKIPGIDDDVDDENDLSNPNAIHVSIVGKPNAGKSTLINKLLNEQRMVVSEVAGTTVDSVRIPVTRHERDFIFIDTAGLRKKAKVDDKTMERYANLKTLRAIAGSDVVIVLLDGTEWPPPEQTAKIVGIAHDRGKGVIFAVNKWDIVEKDHKTVKQYTEDVYSTFKFARYAPVLFLSALTGKRCPNIFQTIIDVYDTARKRVGTSELNKTLETALIKRQPPVYRGQPVKMYFATQVAVAPPTFVMFVNFPGKFGFSYQRYLKNSIRKAFGFEGTDLKILLRKRTEKEERKRPAAANS